LERNAGLGDLEENTYSIFQLVIADFQIFEMENNTSDSKQLLNTTNKNSNVKNGSIPGT